LAGDFDSDEVSLWVEVVLSRLIDDTDIALSRRHVVG
jgi:hypothetical protein